MRMKLGPSSVRLFSKCPQSTISRAASANFRSSSSAGCLRPWSHCLRISPQRVNFALAAPLILGERVRAAAKVESKGHGAQAEIAPHRVEQIAAVALRQLVEAVAEHHEARRAALHLRDVAQLDPSAFGGRRRI